MVVTAAGIDTDGTPVRHAHNLHGVLARPVIDAQHDDTLRALHQRFGIAAPSVVTRHPCHIAVIPGVNEVRQRGGIAGIGVGIGEAHGGKTEGQRFVANPRLDHTGSGFRFCGLGHCNSIMLMSRAFNGVDDQGLVDE